MSRFLSILLVASMTLASACVASGRRGASMGFDYFLERKECNTELTRVDQQDTFLPIYNALRAGFALDNADRGKASVVITGDSIAALFLPHRMERYLPGMNAVNRGIGGDTVGLLATRLESDVLALRPRTVVISIGGNDILQGRCLDHTLNLTRDVIRTIKNRSPATRVLMTSVPPTLTWKANQIVPFYNWQLKYITMEIAGVEYLDLWQEMSARQLPELAPAFHSTVNGHTDIIHFGEEGYRIWGQMILAHVR
jgi:lysophospholipase L1-like esterase